MVSLSNMKQLLFYLTVFYTVLLILQLVFVLSIHTYTYVWYIIVKLEECRPSMMSYRNMDDKSVCRNKLGIFSLTCVVYDKWKVQLNPFSMHYSIYVSRYSARCALFIVKQKYPTMHNCSYRIFDRAIRKKLRVRSTYKWREILINVVLLTRSRDIYSGNVKLLYQNFINIFLASTYKICYIIMCMYVFV